MNASPLLAVMLFFLKRQPQDVEATDTVDEIDMAPLVHEHVVALGELCSRSRLRDVVTGFPRPVGIRDIDHP